MAIQLDTFDAFHRAGFSRSRTSATCAGSLIHQQYAESVENRQQVFARNPCDVYRASLINVCSPTDATVVWWQQIKSARLLAERHAVS
jgi:hypothetical protein